MTHGGTICLVLLIHAVNICEVISEDEKSVSTHEHPLISSPLSIKLKIPVARMSKRHGKFYARPNRNSEDYGHRHTISTSVEEKSIGNTTMNGKNGTTETVILPKAELILRGDSIIRKREIRRPKKFHSNRKKGKNEKIERKLRNFPNKSGSRKFGMENGNLNRPSKRHWSVNHNMQRRETLSNKKCPQKLKSDSCLQTKGLEKQGQSSDQNRSTERTTRRAVFLPASDTFLSHVKSAKIPSEVIETYRSEKEASSDDAGMTSIIPTFPQREKRCRSEPIASNGPETETMINHDSKKFDNMISGKLDNVGKEPERTQTNGNSESSQNKNFILGGNQKMKNDYDPYLQAEDETAAKLHNQNHDQATKSEAEDKQDSYEEAAFFKRDDPFGDHAGFMESSESSENDEYRETINDRLMNDSEEIPYARRKLAKREAMKQRFSWQIPNFDVLDRMGSDWSFLNTNPNTLEETIKLANNNRLSITLPLGNSTRTRSLSLRSNKEGLNTPEMINEVTTIRSLRQSLAPKRIEDPRNEVPQTMSPRNLGEAGSKDERLLSFFPKESPKESLGEAGSKNERLLSFVPKESPKESLCEAGSKNERLLSFVPKESPKENLGEAGSKNERLLSFVPKESPKESLGEAGSKNERLLSFVPKESPKESLGEAGSKNERLLSFVPKESPKESLGEAGSKNERLLSFVPKESHPVPSKILEIPGSKVSKTNPKFDENPNRGPTEMGNNLSTEKNPSVPMKNDAEIIRRKLEESRYHGLSAANHSPTGPQDYRKNLDNSRLPPPGSSTRQEPSRSDDKLNDDWPLSPGPITCSLDSPVTTSFATNTGQFDYVVSLQARANRQSDYHHACTGVLIDPDHVIVAAHCTHQLCDGCGLAIVVGNDLCKISDSLNGKKENIVRVKTINEHENYKDSTRINDISIIQLKSRLKVKPAELPETDYGSAESLSSVGWGELLWNNYKLNVTKMQQGIPMIKHTPSQAEHGIIFVRPYGIDLTGTTRGDFGGILLSSKNRLIGLQSLPASNETDYEAYTRVYAYLPWIDHTLKTARR